MGGPVLTPPAPPPEAPPEAPPQAPPQALPEALKAQKRRNLMLALAIGAFVLLVFLVTVTKLRDGLLAGGG